MLTGAAGGGTGDQCHRHAHQRRRHHFLIQFFSSLVADPSGFGQGQTFLGSTTVTTSGAGIFNINFNLSSGLAVGTYVTAPATNESTGDTSAFSNAVEAQAVSVAFSSANLWCRFDRGVRHDRRRPVRQPERGRLGRTRQSKAPRSPARVMWRPRARSVSARCHDRELFGHDPPQSPSSTTTSTINLTLSQPGGGATLGSIASAVLTITYPSGTGQKFVVTNTNDSGPGSLRQAIEDANADTNPGVDHITFEIPASTAGNLNVPVPGFDPITQTWTINLASPLPAITHPVSIDGYTQASVGVPFRYPDQVSSAVQTLLVSGLPSGGSFTLTTSAPLPVGITPPIPYNATAAQVLSALEGIIPAGDVSVTGGPVNTADVFVTFQGTYGAEAIPNLIATSSLLGGTSPGVVVQTTTVGGIALIPPLLISTVPNAAAAIDGNNAQIRVVIDGAAVPIGSSDIGFVINASNSSLSGLAIEGFRHRCRSPQPHRRRRHHPRQRDRPVSCLSGRPHDRRRPPGPEHGRARRHRQYAARRCP